jgi:hypothetical protein
MMMPSRHGDSARRFGDAGSRYGDEAEERAARRARSGQDRRSEEGGGVDSHQV